MNPKSTYRVEEAAELCRLSRRDILEAIEKGLLEASRLGEKSYQISLYSLQRFYRRERGGELFPDLAGGAHDQTVREMFETIGDLTSEEEFDQFSKDFSHSGSR